MKLIILSFLLLPIFAYSQNTYEVFPIANDSTINEINPYLTTYWYSGWNSNGNIAAVEEYYSPLWLAFVETDFIDSYKVVAYNFDVYDRNNISYSPKNIIVDSDNWNIKSDPIIENFLGKPVAIWSETDSLQTDLFYSVLSDSSWNNPQRITNNSSVENMATFLTVDSWNISTQESPFNYLIWNSDNSIVASKLNKEFSWIEKDTLYKSDFTISDIDIRQGYNGDLWMFLSEYLDNDSSNIKAFIQLKDSTKWNGPYLFKNIEGESLQCEINIDPYWSTDNRMLVTWIEHNIVKNQSVYFKNDSLKFGYEETEQIQFADGALYSSNTLSSGGCVIGPFPYYFMSVPTDTTTHIGIGAGYFDNYRGWETKNSVDELTISGLDMQVFMAAWSEHDSTQSDIYLVFNYIPMGDVNNNLPDKVFTLEQNYPNPFNPSTTISYSLSQSEFVQLKVYDILGREVATLVNAVKSPGVYHVEFDAQNLASGIYYYQMKSGSFIQTKKMIFLK